MYKGSLIILCFCFLQPATAQGYNIVLGRPADTRITVSILFDQPVQFYIEYGVQSGHYPYSMPVMSGLSGKPVEVDISGLLPDQQYYYHLRYKTPSASLFLISPEYRFHTQRSKNSTFTFTIEADEHLYDIKGVQPLYQVCLNNQAADKPDFMLSLGDIFGDDHYPESITSVQLDELHKAYRPLLGSICHSIPFYVCLGNHEGENDYTLLQHPPENLAVWGTLWRKYYYPNPYPDQFYSGNLANEQSGIGFPENYYAWTWGDALFVVLDAYRDQSDTTDKPLGWSWSLGKPQYDWLKKTLEESTKKYKFVFAHHIRGQGRGGIINARYFEWGGFEQNGTNYTFNAKRPGWGKPIHQLFKDNKVTVFFQGHDHVFAREIMDSIIYQAVPMPSDSTYSLGKIANAGAYTDVTQDGSGHIRVTVSPSCVKVDYVRACLPADTAGGIYKNSEVSYSYTIGDCTVPVVNGINTGPVTICPNPATDLISLKFTGAEPSVFDVSIYNMAGQPVIHSTSKVIAVSQLMAGVYSVRIRTSSYTNTQKIVIIK